VGKKGEETKESLRVKSSRKTVKEEKPLWHSRAERLRGTEVDLKEYVEVASIVCTDLSKNKEMPGRLGGEQGWEGRVCILALGSKKSK